MRFQRHNLIFREHSSTSRHFINSLIVKHDDDLNNWLLIIQIDVLVTQLIAESQERTMIQTFDSAFTASHDRADLRIREVLDELQDEEILSFAGQAPDKAQERILFLRADQIPFRVIPF